VAQFARAFGYNANHIKITLVNGIEEPKVHGLHPAFDKDSEGEILAWIEAQAEKYIPMTRTDFSLLQSEIFRSGQLGWVDSFVLRRTEDLIEMKSSPQEETRLEVLQAFWMKR
jgi:hypothetical protein